MTTNEITKSALEELTLKGFECWRSNNIAVRGRIFIGRKGVSDILGFQIRPATGIMMLCEVKGGGDTLSKEQIELLNTAKKAGAFCFIATVDKNGKYLLKEYQIIKPINS